jgi:hypothetical protein
MGFAGEAATYLLQDCRLIHKALDGDKVEFTCEAGIDFVCRDRKKMKELQKGGCISAR